jgi:hypothetical protein
VIPCDHDDTDTSVVTRCDCGSSLGAWRVNYPKEPDQCKAIFYLVVNAVGVEDPECKAEYSHAVCGKIVIGSVDAVALFLGYWLCLAMKPDMGSEGEKPIDCALYESNRRTFLN